MYSADRDEATLISDLENLTVRHRDPVLDAILAAAIARRMERLRLEDEEMERAFRAYQNAEAERALAAHEKQVNPLPCPSDIPF